jgi:hypothetical protein
MNNVPDKSCTENQNTHFMLNNGFFENLGDNMEKYCRDGQTVDGNMAHANCVLDN